MMAIYLPEKNRTEYAQKKPKITPFEYNLDVNIICDNIESKHEITLITQKNVENVTV